MIKRAYTAQMSYEVSSKEKMVAEKALLCLDHLLDLLSNASNHLNILKTSLKDNAGVESESIINNRAQLRVYRDQSVESFNKFKNQALVCVNLLQTFDSDVNAVKMIKSFNSSIDELEDLVNSYVGLFDDLHDNDFATNVVDEIVKIQDKCDVIRDITDDRIITYIKTDIIAVNWIDNLRSYQGKSTDDHTESNNPLTVDLFHQRQQRLNKA